MTLEEFMKLMEEQFENVGIDRCWEWPKAKDEDGYGTLGLKFPDGSYKKRGAHRIAYLVTFGDPGSTGHRKNMVMHTCNNPGCFNPGHLVAGTHKANSGHYQLIDAKNKKMTKLPKEVIHNMQVDRVSGMSVIDICEKYGVSKSSVFKYTNRIATDK